MAAIVVKMLVIMLSLFCETGVLHRDRVYHKFHNIITDNEAANNGTFAVDNIFETLKPEVYRRIFEDKEGYVGRPNFESAEYVALPIMYI
jgi:hypothetical protein